MTSTTHPEFNDKTEALEVAKAFPENVKGRNILITGVNKGGIGFATAEALVCPLVCLILQLLVLS